MASRITAVSDTPEEVLVRVTSYRATSPCPMCSIPSSAIHSLYRRHPKIWTPCRELCKESPAKKERLKRYYRHTLSLLAKTVHFQQEGTTMPVPKKRVPHPPPT